MSTIITPGAGVLFMKVGTHAQESLEDIIERKSKEIKEAGFAMWGYGGNTCHPRTMVQPFAEGYAEKKKSIYLVMQEMESKHFAEPIRAQRYSVDGLTWQDVPAAINVRGSRFALVVESLTAEKHVLPLAQTRVAIGPNQGRLGDKYIQGRVDKACLEVVGLPGAGDSILEIGLVARLRAPYAVFLSDK